MSTRQPRANIGRAIVTANAAWESVVRGEDMVSMAELGALMNAVGMPSQKRDQAVAIRQFQVKGVSTSSIKKKQFVDWYVSQSANFAGAQLNRLLVKDQLGKSKTTSYELPGENFTYGVGTKWGEESAGDVALTWVAGNQSKMARGKRNIIAENKAVVQSGQCSSKGWQEAREGNKRYEKFRTGQRASRRTNPYSSKGLCYGKVSEESPAVAKVLATNVMPENYNYPDLSGKIIPGKLPLPRPTKCSELLANLNQRGGPGPKDLFKLKKFQKISSKVNSYNSSRK
jgi:hypothetical protein